MKFRAGRTNNIKKGGYRYVYRNCTDDIYNMQCNHHRDFWENQDREIPNELYAGQINFIKGEKRNERRNRKNDPD